MLQSQAMLRAGFARRAFFSTAAKATAATTPSTPIPAKKKKRLVVAVGGNALQRRGDRLTIENMLVRCLYVADMDSLSSTQGLENKMDLVPTKIRSIQLSCLIFFTE